MTTEDISQAMTRHLDAFWPENRRTDFQWSVGPIRKTLPAMVITRIAPRSSAEPWVYVSRGVWEVERDGERIELVLQAPYDDPIHIETLTMAANFHADPRYRLYCGKILDIGRPWLEGASCDHLLVSLPYLIGPQFEYLRLSEMTIRFLWLLPITASEAAYARAHGVDALEDAFERSGFDTLDPNRRSVV